MNTRLQHTPAHPATPVHHAQGHHPGPGTPGQQRAGEPQGRFGEALFLLGRPGQRAGQNGVRGQRPTARSSPKSRPSQDNSSGLDADAGGDERRQLALSFSLQTDAGEHQGDGNESGSDDARSQQRRLSAGAGSAAPRQHAVAMLAAATEWARAALAHGGDAALMESLTQRGMRLEPADAAPLRAQVLALTAAALKAAGGRLDFGDWPGVRGQLLKADTALKPPRTGLSELQQHLNLLRPVLTHQLRLRRTPSQLADLLGRNGVLRLVASGLGGGGLRAARPGAGGPPGPGPAGASPASSAGVPAASTKEPSHVV